MKSISEKYSEDQYKIYTWKNWMVLFTMLNPGFSFNELILGQRTPKILLEKKIPDVPRYERMVVPCPHCGTLHDSRIWSKSKGFKNWFGLYCIKCGEIIPCLLSVTSYLILAITYPIWGWFKDSLKEKWLAKQPERFCDIDLSFKNEPINTDTWLKMGLAVSVIWFIIFAIIFPFVFGTEITWRSVRFTLYSSVVMGVVFVFVMRRYFAKKIKAA